MKRRRYTILFLVVIAAGGVVGCLLWLRPLAADIFSLSMVVDNEKRTCRICVPHNLTTPAPIVLAFHGTGDSAESMAAYSHLDHLAADHGFLLIYPSSRKGMWTAVRADSQTLDTNPDVRFFDAILDRVSSNYEVDRDRVYLVGMSNGGSFSQLLGNLRSSVVAAVVTHSGSRPQSPVDTDHLVPTLMIVGSDDLAAGSMQSDLEYYRGTGHEAELIMVAGLGHTWSTRHNPAVWRFLRNQRLSR